MIGENLKKAAHFMDMAIRKEAEGAETMMNKCIDQALKLEKAGLAAGESWDSKPVHELVNQ